VLGHVAQQLVAGDAGVVDDDVELARGFGDAFAGVRGGDVEQQGAAADGVQGGVQRFLFLRTVDADDLRAFARQAAGDGGADAARGAGDQGGLAGQRSGGQARLQALGGRRQRQRLAGDEGRVAAEQEAQRAVEPELGAVGDGDEVGGGALAADLLGQALDEAGQGAGGGGFRGLGAACRRAADDDDAGACGQAGEVLVEEAVQLLQLRRAGGAGGVEYQ
jgi:hypothetical protein